MADLKPFKEAERERLIQFQTMKLIGIQMSNVMHNLSQCEGRPLRKSDVEMMRQLYEQWDAIFK